MSLVERLIIGRVEIIDAALQAGIHYGKVLIRQRHVDADIGFVAVEELHQLGHLVGVHAVGNNVLVSGALLHGLRQAVALLLGARSQNQLSENLRMLRTFVSHYGANTAGSYDDCFSHFQNQFLFDCKFTKFLVILPKIDQNNESDTDSGPLRA